MTAENKQLDYSIVICTYNPDERLLKRCLNAISNLDRTGLSTEVIIVDNNSRVPVDSLSYVRNYFGKIPSLRILFAVKQGLKYARIEAITAAKGKHLVYFDYDNEPEKNYLQ
jgi:glycosyltransferase involved in cell wall biosynthesis